VPVATGVLANDSDLDGQTLSAVRGTGPTHGTLTLNSNGSFSYIPATNYTGPDSFTYTVSDGTASSAPVTVIITVTNVAPAAVTDNYNASQNQLLTINSTSGVLANDTDADGNTLTAIKVTDPAHGQVTLASNGSFTYTPTTGYIGPDSFTYKANDGTLDSPVGTVNITIAANVAPVAATDSYNVNQGQMLMIAAAQGVLANDTDANGNPLTASKFSDPTHGQLTFASDGSFTYTPALGYNGPDSFTYKANDGMVDSSVGTVNITVAANGQVQAAPSPEALDEALAMEEDWIATSIV
jgi:VCBS repeat-containing protein